MKKTAYYLPGLNGIRALASLFVLICHITQFLRLFHLHLLLGEAPNGTPKVLMMGSYGVILFFSLSGFLITYLLIIEKQAGAINIKKFYFRRMLRIWPLYYTYLLIVLLTYYLFKIDYPNVLPFYCFYTANIPFILRTPLLYVEHFWSLGVEEQFYLFWPWIVKKTTRKLLPVAIGIIGGIITIKLALHFIFREPMAQLIIDVFPFHCMMMGGVAAILYRQKNKPFLKFFDNKITQSFAWLVILAIIINKYHITSVLDSELISCVAIAIIIGQVNVKNRVINLEVQLLDFLGRISFGMYIVHPLLIFYLSRLIGPWNIPPAYKYPLVYVSVIGTTIGVAYLSYTYFESYFLKLKEKFAVVKSGNHDVTDKGAVQLKPVRTIT